MSKLSREMNQAGRQAIDESGAWMNGVTAIVAENQDPEKQHRIKVIIPSIDEDVMYDEWARAVVFCLGNARGTAFIPPKGSEVVLFGQLGQKYNLFYASLYNEEMPMPDGYPDENTVGIHAPGNLKFIAELLGRMQAQNIEIVAAELAKITGQNIESLAQQLNKLTGQNIEIIADELNKLQGDEVRAEGSTKIRLHSDGTIEIAGGAVKVTGSSIKLHNRTVNPTGPNI